MTCSPKRVSEPHDDLIAHADYFHDLANERANVKLLEEVGKKVMKAAQSGRLSVKVGYLPERVVEYLEQRGFVYQENQDDACSSFLHF